MGGTDRCADNFREESLLYGHEQAGQDAKAGEGGNDRDDSKEKMTFES